MASAMFGPSNGATTMAPMTAAVLSRDRPIPATTDARTTSDMYALLSWAVPAMLAYTLFTTHGRRRACVGARIGRGTGQRPRENGIQRLHQHEQWPSGPQPLVKPIHGRPGQLGAKDGAHNRPKPPTVLYPVLLAEFSKDLLRVVAGIRRHVSLDDSKGQSIRLLSKRP